MKNLKTNSSWIILLIMMATIASCGPKKTDSTVVAEDQNKEKTDNTDLKDDFEYAVNAADGGMFEVQLGQLAANNGSTPGVKQLGQMMVTDHSKANEELKALAATKNISLPVVISDKLQKKYDDCANKSGVDFDKAYASAMVSAHKDDIDLFKKEADKGKDSELKAFAGGKLPVLNHHLEMAKSTEEALKNMKEKK
jgi:putative membrane protein